MVPWVFGVRVSKRVDCCVYLFLFRANVSLVGFLFFFKNIIIQLREFFVFAFCFSFFCFSFYVEFVFASVLGIFAVACCCVPVSCCCSFFALELFYFVFSLSALEDMCRNLV